MSEQGIIEKFKRLQAIMPSRDFARSSRSIILMSKQASFEIAEDAKLVGQLNWLKQIKPDANFAFSTRQSILEAKKFSSRRILELFSLKNIIYQFTNYGLSIGLAALLLAVAITGGYWYLTPDTSLSAANNKALISEASNISKDIDVHLKELGYYAIAARKSNLALNEAYHTNFGYMNEAVIEREAKKVSSQPATAPKSGAQSVDELLDQAQN